VAEVLLDSLRVLALGNQERGTCVAEVVDANLHERPARFLGGLRITWNEIGRFVPSHWAVVAGGRASRALTDVAVSILTQSSLGGGFSLAWVVGRRIGADKLFPVGLKSSAC
jgi:hypothetical protein